MTGPDRLPAANFGFAQMRPTGQARPQRRPESATVRIANADRNPLRASQIAETLASDVRSPDYHPRTHIAWPTYLLALSLAGIVYFFAFAGIWSLYQTFDAALPSTPIGQSVPAEPINQPADLRDARLQDQPKAEGVSRLDGQTPI